MPPTITVSQTAAKVLQEAMSQEGGRHVRLEISADLTHSLALGEPAPSDEIVTVDGIAFLLDPSSAARADGLSIDYHDGPGESGFKLDNPNEPVVVRQMSVRELKELMDSEPVELLDVRSIGEWNVARIEGARLVDEQGAAYIASLPKDTRLIFQCHHGIRSQSAAQHFLQQGYTQVYNLVGGIDAWSLHIDQTVPRY